jgi:hypothetical protein
VDPNTDVPGYLFWPRHSCGILRRHSKCAHARTEPNRSGIQRILYRPSVHEDSVVLTAAVWHLPKQQTGQGDSLPPLQRVRFKFRSSLRCIEQLRRGKKYQTVFLLSSSFFRIFNFLNLGQLALDCGLETWGVCCERYSFVFLHFAAYHKSHIEQQIPSDAPCRGHTCLSWNRPSICKILQPNCCLRASFRWDALLLLYLQNGSGLRAACCSRPHIKRKIRSQ